ncbi:MAG: helix-turn-helix domain-containing protein [Actinomycetota bacterium]
MHRVVVLAHQGVQSLDVTGPTEVFGAASQLLTRTGPGDRRRDSGAAEGYDVRVVSLDGGVVTTESAVRLDTDRVASIRGRIDSLVVPGGLSVWRHGDDDRFLAALRRLVARTDRLISICTGAQLLAAAGALDGHVVATHWARAARIAAANPTVTVDADPIFLHSPGGDGPDVWSSAGVTAGIDLCLALVEHDHDTALAQEVGRWLVMYLRRPGGQSQFATPTWVREAEPGPIRAAQESVIADPGADHTVARLAERVAMSERHFVRRFADEVGTPPARFVRLVRVDAARHELERSGDTVDAVARRCGFGSAETLRRAMQRHVGVSPEAYRRRFAHHPTDRSAHWAAQSSGKDTA